MKAMLLRVGIDKGTDGALGPIFSDGSFEYIPPSEWEPSREQSTYRTTIGKNGCPLATYLPKRTANRVIHCDPEFVTFTYGDSSAKRRYLLKLRNGDVLAFYAGLQPFHKAERAAGLFVIGYFSVVRVIDFNILSDKQRAECFERYRNNAHVKRCGSTDNLTIIAGDPAQSALLRKALRISEGRPMRNGRIGQAASKECEQALGIRGFIERSMPPRMIEGSVHIATFLQLLAKSTK